MNKTLEQWALVDARLCATQNSVAANEFLISDAKKDIAELGRMLAAASVPPAGDVEVIGYGSKDDYGNKSMCLAPKPDLEPLVRLSDYTRLTAERDGLLAQLTESRRQVQLLNEAGEFLDDVSQGVEDKLRAENAALQSELTKARELLNTPHTDDWLEGVRLEAGHQIGRLGTEHDAGKSPADWFWLIGYLAQKAMTAQMAGNEEKARHHTISTGAALLNWFRAIVGDSNLMRPGIDAAQNVDEICGQDAEAAKGGA